MNSTWSKKIKNCCFAVIVIFIMSSCNYYQEFSLPQVSTIFSPVQNNIHTIAILPFKNLTDNEELPEILRKSLFASLIMKDYDLIKLRQIDKKLQEASYHIDDINKIEHSKLAEILNADGIIYGTATKCSKIYSVIYSRITIGAEVEMIDAKSSEVIWKVDHVELSHSGAPPFSPFSIPEKIILSSANVRDKVINDTAEKLAKKLVESMPLCNSTESISPYNLAMNDEDQSPESEIDEGTIVKESEYPKGPVIDIKRNNDIDEVHYKVQPKDTLYKIAKMFYGHGSKWKNIKSANNEIESSTLTIGYDLFLPDVPVLANICDADLLDKEHIKKAVYKVKPDDSLPDMASALYQDSEKWHLLYEENKDEIGDTGELVEGQVLIITLTYEDQIRLTPSVFNKNDQMTSSRLYY